MLIVYINFFIILSFILNLYIYNPVYDYGKPKSLTYHKPNQEIYKWIKLNTPLESTFITRPSSGELSLFTNRKIFVTWQPVPIDKKRIQEWKKRIDLLENYESINKKDIMNSVKQYSVQYFITKNKNLQFEKVFDNSNLIIYKI